MRARPSFFFRGSVLSNFRGEQASQSLTPIERDRNAAGSKAAMAVPEGDNVFDVMGTVLYRTITSSEHELELLYGRDQSDHGGSSAASNVPHSTPLPEISSMSARYGPYGGAFRSKQRKGGRLAPLAASAAVATSISRPGGGVRTVGSEDLMMSLTAAVAAGGDRRELTVPRALAQLFPACSASASPHDDGDDAGRDDGVNAADSVLAQTQRSHDPRDRGSPSGLSSGVGEGTGTESLVRVAATNHLSRLDVVLLFEHLERRRASENARQRGVVCSNRERINDDGLRELMRQITLLCPERGLLLDELTRSMAQSTDTYNALFDSACQYAVRKSTERDLHAHLFDEKDVLDGEVRRLENRVNEWRAKYDGMKKRFDDQQAADKKLHDDEIAYAKKANQQFISEIKRLASEAERLNEK